jgi:hypothetical protein
MTISVLYSAPEKSSRAVTREASGSAAAGSLDELLPSEDIRPMSSQGESGADFMFKDLESESPRVNA